MNEWWIFRGTGEPHDNIDAKLPEPPGWRTFSSRGGNTMLPTRERDSTQQAEQRLGPGVSGAKFLADDREKAVINAALYLRQASS